MKEGQSSSGWTLGDAEIAGEIEGQAGKLLAEARDDYNAFEMLRLRAARAYARTDPAMCVLAGAIAGYLLLAIMGQRFLPPAMDVSQLGLTPWILAILAVALAIRWTLWRRSPRPGSSRKATRSASW